MAGEEKPRWPQDHPKIRERKRQEAFPSPEDRQVGHLIGPVVEIARKIVSEAQEKISRNNLSSSEGQKENRNPFPSKQLHFDVDGNKFEAVKPKEETTFESG